MYRNIKLSLIILTGLILVMTCSGCTDSRKSVTVKTVAAVQQELEVQLQLSGVLAPAQTVDISSKISGRVVSLGFKAGSRVKEGDILVELDTESINGQLMQARASLASAQASAQTAANQAEIAMIDLDAAQRDYDHKRLLFEAGAISESEMAEARDDLNSTQKKYETANGPALAQAQAAIDTAQASIKNYEIQLANATIKSPINGVVASQNVDVGEVLSPGVTVISIIDNTALILKSTITQEDLGLLSSGQEVEVLIDGYADFTTWKGTVTCIGPVALNTGEVFPVEIMIKNDGSLMAGLSAHTSSKAIISGIVIPSSCIIQENGESCVFVIKDQAAARRVVATGRSYNQFTQVLSGLKEGELVAASNVNALADHTPVDIE